MFIKQIASTIKARLIYLTLMMSIIITNLYNNFHSDALKVRKDKRIPCNNYEAGQLYFCYRYPHIFPYLFIHLYLFNKQESIYAVAI